MFPAARGAVKEVATLGARMPADEGAPVAEVAYQRIMSPLEIGILGLYFLTLVILAVLGTHRYVMIYLYLPGSRPEGRARCPFPRDLPRVTVQLPIYNEMYVVERLLDSVAAIRYPKDLLEIQVLDDSTDETQGIARRAVERYREQGFDIHYIHRTDRTGFKAGALDAGLAVAKGEFVLIFDADFVAPPDVLEKTVGQFSDPEGGDGAGALGPHQPRLLAPHPGAVGACSTATSSSSTAGRNRSGRFFNFNGTAGLWRRAAIDDAGGWQHDTLTEDLDLSYRAQMKGWRFVYLQDVVCPAELPVEMNAFKSQQHRWAKGSVQTCLKLLPRVLASDLPLHVKVESAFHLTANFAYPLMVLLSRAHVPGHGHPLQHGPLRDADRGRAPLPGRHPVRVLLLPVEPEGDLRRDWKSRLKYLPAVLAVGIGISVNNAKAVLEALFGHRVGLHAHAQVPASRARPTSGRQSATRAPSTSCPSSSCRSASTSASWPGTRSPTASGAPFPSS